VTLTLQESSIFNETHLKSWTGVIWSVNQTHTYANDSTLIDDVILQVLVKMALGVCMASAIFLKVNLISKYTVR